MSDAEHAPGPHEEVEGNAVYICDLQPGLSESDLRQVFGHYGDIISIEQVDVACEEAAVVQYTTAEAAEEAQEHLHFALLRGKTCRCLSLPALRAVRQTMESGHRLIVENLDPKLESRGLRDVFALFGCVLDCKVELDDDERPRGFGFVHFERTEDAARALRFVDRMQIGESVVELRYYQAGDGALFTGCLYELPRGCLQAPPSQAEEAAAGPLEEEGAPHRSLLPTTPMEREQAAMEYFKSLEYHHVEVLEDLPAKLQRLHALIETYDPNQDRQMMVVANAAHLQALTASLAEVVDPADFDAVQVSTPKDKRQAVIDNFEAGNIFILALTSEVSTRRDFDLNRPAGILVNLDFPNTIQLHLYRIYRRTERSTRIHSFFTPECDSKLVVPLMSTLQDSGHEIPEDLMELWSSMDQTPAEA